MKIGLLGCGTIGGGVLELVDGLNRSDIKIVKVFDMPCKKPFLKERFAESADDITLNPEIDTVVEAMGGDRFPYECIKKALLSGKNVVTSNKEVVSVHFEEFYKTAKEKGVYFLCEASVGGGIPLICSVIDELKVNSANRIYGIINGTTNYVLTRMREDGLTLEKALEIARELGFAEYDATADLEGLDMVRKICILSSIAYKGYLPYDKIVHSGISKIKREILEDIKKRGYSLKFVAESRLEGNTVTVAVEPVLIKPENPLNTVNYEYNAVYVDFSNSGTLGFYGKGAGKFPTAAAMVSDLVRIKEGAAKYYFECERSIKVENFRKKASYYAFADGKGKIGGYEDGDYEFIARIF